AVHQDDPRALPGAGTGDPCRPPVRTSRDHRGPGRTRPAGLPRLGSRAGPVSARILLRLLVALLVLAAGPALAQLKLFGAEPELLDPEKAFRMSTRTIDASTLEVRFAIADGYYMYRDKFRFALAAPEDASRAKLGEPDFPQGTVKEDK